MTEMTRHAFRSALAAMRFIDRGQLAKAGVEPERLDGMWSVMRANPAAWFLTASDEDAERVWRLIQAAKAGAHVAASKPQQDEPPASETLFDMGGQAAVALGTNVYQAGGTIDNVLTAGQSMAATIIISAAQLSGVPRATITNAFAAGLRSMVEKSVLDPQVLN